MELDLNKLLAEASKACNGLSDFGDSAFLEPAHVLIKAFNNEAGLSPQGKAIWRKRFIELLKNRLVIEDYFNRHPEIADESITTPTVIVGLPRTGTTLLQRILGCDRRFYPMLAWEARFPAPFTEPNGSVADPRIARAVAMTDAMIAANPNLLSIHPLNALEPDEEGILLEHTFQSFFDSYADIPSYTQWMWEHDQTPAYRYLKRMLQFIQWQKRQRSETAQSWILKTPHHLRQLHVLFDVFPDVRIIQTHRDPLKTIPSIGSFAFNMWKLAMTNPDPKRAGRQWSDIWSRGMRESLALRDRLPSDRFHDIWFADTIHQPLAVIKGIYQYLNLSFPAETQERMLKYLEDNSREKRPLHEYSLDYYGLSEEQIKIDFKAYRERFNFT